MNQKYFSVIGAAISWFAVIAQLWLMLLHRTAGLSETIIQFFSYFTILTNIIVAVCFTSAFLNRGSRIKRFFQKPGTLTAIAVYIVIVGLIYQILLRQLWQPTGLQMVVNELLHSFIPLEFIVYWFLYGKKGELQWRMFPYWLIYPLLYAVYVLSRGEVSGFYPYPFINVTDLGWQQTLINVGGLFLLFIAFSLLFIGAGKLLHNKEGK
jgi:hypothetical protein